MLLEATVDLLLELELSQRSTMILRMALFPSLHGSWGHINTNVMMPGLYYEWTTQTKNYASIVVYCIAIDEPQFQSAVRSNIVTGMVHI